MSENPDAEKAALAEYARHTRVCSKEVGWPTVDRRCNCGLDALLANLSPAAKSLMEKARAHDAMKAENERLREDRRELVMLAKTLAEKEPE